MKNILTAIILFWSKSTLAFKSGIVLSLVAASIVTAVVVVTFSSVNNTGLPNNGFTGINLYPEGSDNNRIYENVLISSLGPQATTARVFTVTACSASCTSGATSLTVTGVGTFPQSYISGLTVTLSTSTGPASIVVTSGYIQGGVSTTLVVPALSATAIVAGTTQYTVTKNLNNTPNLLNTDTTVANGGSPIAYGFLPPALNSLGWPSESFQIQLSAFNDAYSSKVLSCGFNGSVASVSQSSGGGSLVTGTQSITGTISGSVLTVTSSTGIAVGQAVSDSSGTNYIGHITGAIDSTHWAIQNVGGYSGTSTTVSNAIQHITYASQDYSVFLSNMGTGSSNYTFTTPSGTFSNLQCIRPDDGLAWGTTQRYTTRYTNVVNNFTGWHRFFQWQNWWDNYYRPVSLQVTWDGSGSTSARPMANSGWAYAANSKDAFCNANPATTTWIDPNPLYQFSNSWESIICHANTFNITPWVTLSGKITPAYLTSLGTLSANNLKTPIAIEALNEVWNTSYKAYNAAYTTYKPFLGIINSTTSPSITSITYAAHTLTVVFSADIGIAATNPPIAWGGMGGASTSGAQYQGVVDGVTNTATYVSGTATLVITCSSCTWTVATPTPAVYTVIYKTPFYNGVNIAQVAPSSGYHVPVYAFTEGAQNQSSLLQSAQLYTMFMTRLAYDAFANAYAIKTPSAVSTGSTITGCPGACVLNVGTITSGTIAQNQIMTGPLGSIWTAKIGTNVSGGSSNGSVWNISNGVNTTSSQTITTTTQAVINNIKPAYMWQIFPSQIDQESAMVWADYINASAWGGTSSWLWATGGAPYLAAPNGLPGTSGTSTLWQNMVNSMSNDGSITNGRNIPATTSDMVANVASARLHGVHAVSYEGGDAVQYLTNPGTYAKSDGNALLSFGTGIGTTCTSSTNYDLGSSTYCQWVNLLSAGMDGHTHFAVHGVTYNPASDSNFQPFDDVWHTSGSGVNTAVTPQWNGMVNSLTQAIPSITPGRYNGIISFDPNNNGSGNAGGAFDYGTNQQTLYYLSGDSNNISISATAKPYAIVWNENGTNGNLLNFPIAAYLTAGTTPSIRYALEYNGSGKTFSVYMRQSLGNTSSSDTLLGTTTPYNTTTDPTSNTTAAKFTGYITGGVLTLSTSNTFGTISSGDIVYYGGIQTSGQVTINALTGGTANTAGATYSLNNASGVVVGNSGTPYNIKTLPISKFSSAVSLGTISTTGWYVITLKATGTKTNIGIDAVSIQ